MNYRKRTGIWRLLVLVALVAGVFIANQTPATWLPAGQEARAQSVPEPPEPPQDPPPDTVRLVDRPDDPEEPEQSGDQRPDTPSDEERSSDEPDQGNSSEGEAPDQTPESEINLVVLDDGTTVVSLKNPVATISTLPSGESVVTLQNGTTIPVGNISRMTDAEINALSVSPKIRRALFLIRALFPMQQTMTNPEVPSVQKVQRRIWTWFFSLSWSVQSQSS
jgi:hypothetical protein